MSQLAQGPAGYLGEVSFYSRPELALSGWELMPHLALLGDMKGCALVPEDDSSSRGRR